MLSRRACRAETVSVYFGALKAFEPELIIASAMGLTDSLCISKVLQKKSPVPVIFLGLQVMVPSNYIGALGVLPRLPRCCGMNKAAWKLVIKMLSSRGSNSLIEALPAEPGPGRAHDDALLVSYQEFFDHCSCSPRFPCLFAVSTALHGPFPPDFSDLCRALGPICYEPEMEVGVDFGGSELALLEEFLAKGDAPVYMGYGSMVYRSGKFMSLLSLRALKSTGCRTVILRGWAELGLQEIDSEPDAEELRAFCDSRVLFVETAPHARLFPRCSVIVHHGGAGTTYAAARSGVPSVIVPILLDQFVHARLMNEKGIGLGLHGMSSTSPDELSQAILTCLQSTHIREKAASLGRDLANENGATKFVGEVRRFFADFIDSGVYAKEKQASLARRRRSRGWHWRDWLCCAASFCQANGGEH